MDFPGKKVMPRFFIIAVLFGLVGLAIVAKAAYIMFVQKDFWMGVSSKFQRSNVVVPPKRGDILSDKGEVLAASIPEYKIYLDFLSGETDSLRLAKDQRRRDSLFLDKLDSISGGLSHIFADVDSAKMRAHLLEAFGKRFDTREYTDPKTGKTRISHPHRNVLIYPKRISYIQFRQVKQLPLFRLPSYSGGFHEEKFETRKNPYGRLAARTIGDLYGGKDSARSGIELGCDTLLRGKPGSSHRQKVMNRYLTIIDQPAVDGYDVQTTININMQDICEKALGDQLRALQEADNGEVEFGVCILMEVATGDVKAITSLSRMADGSFQEIQNRAVSNMMEPGSVFKPMSFLVAFDDGLLGLDDRVDTQGGVVTMHKRQMRDHNWRTGGYGTLTARQCIQFSSNVGVSHFIDKFYGNNPQAFVDGIYATGVADSLAIPIPGYSKPRIKSPKAKSWSATDLPWMSIGYVTQIPPINTLTFYNGIANNGRMMQPRFVKATLRNGEVVKAYDPVVLREHMASDDAVKKVQTCLREVVTLGVAKRTVNSKLVHAAGKTGTAQVWSAAGKTSAYLVSFAGYFPYENPKYSCIVCINKHGFASGGLHCGPVFRRIAETVMAQQRHRSYRAARDSVNMPAPVVHNGNIVAAGRVMKKVGVKYNDNTDRRNEEVAWGVANCRADGVALSSAETPEAEMPDVSGYGLRDAVFRLEQLGLEVSSVGVGRVVGQSLKPGHHYAKGDKVLLTLGRGKEDVAMSDSVQAALRQREEENALQPEEDNDTTKKQPI